MIIYDLSKLDKNLREDIEQSEQFTSLFSRKPDQLLSVGVDAKTVKSLGVNVLTGILYLSPHSISGQNVCPLAKIAQCDLPCLNLSGKGRMSNVQMARLRKTLYWQQFPSEFITQIKKEVYKLIRKADKIGFVPAIRLNGTSDIRWENYLDDFMIETTALGAKWYDYTKLPNRKVDPKIYDLTYSYSGVNGYQKYIQMAIENKAIKRIAVVFRGEKLPTTFTFKDTYYKKSVFSETTLPVVNGYDTDARFLDPENVFVGLCAKGPAKQDTTGFVVD